MASIEDLNIEALARKIAAEWVGDWVRSDSWYGYPNGKKQEKNVAHDYMPSARQIAIRYAELLLSGDK